MRRLRWLVQVVVILTLVASACSDDDETVTPTAEEVAAERLSAIYEAHGLSGPDAETDATAEDLYGYYSTSPVCNDEGAEGNDPEVVAGQIAAGVTDDEPAWLLAAQLVAIVRVYCPTRFDDYSAVVRAALGDEDADRAIEWATIPIDS